MRYTNSWLTAHHIQIDMEKSVTTAWGWLTGLERTPQEKTFDTADSAIADMQRRLGKDMTIEDLSQNGFYLAVVRVTVEPVLVLLPYPDLS
jgi:hypothetical protein